MKPNPIDEMIKWSETHRPEVVEHLKTLKENSQFIPMIDGLLLFIAIGFEAGREYERSNGPEE